MRRDDPALALPLFERHPLHFAGGLFGWLHHRKPGSDPGPTPVSGDCVAVICPPIGPEYTRAHRTLRHLADRLAAAGIPALRFDYDGTGDSAGEDDAPGRIEAWRRSIDSAIREARAWTGCSRACLIGVRLGATLAALEASDADLLVLWNPVVKGRAHARELQAMAMTAGSPQEPNDDALESAGLRVSHETLDTLRGLDLSQATFPQGARVLLVERDDLAADASLPDALQAAGIAHERVSASGWNAMVADHQFTVVPDAALDAIRDWVVNAARALVPRAIAPPAAPGPTSDDAAAAPGATSDRHPGRRDSGNGPGSNCDGTESLHRFGSDGHLFGILSRPATATAKPAVLLLNAGSIHHVGPHRLYVRLARELARNGHPVLRFDFEGIGDSVAREAGRENHPYVSHPIEDIRAAIACLRSAGHERFVLVGLCSGAYHVFRAGLELPDEKIERLVSINPWYFHWREGLSLDTTVNHYESVAAYRSAARDLDRWKKLLRGEVDLARLARVGWTHVAKTVMGRLEDLRETVSPASGTRLSRDLRALLELRRPFHLIQSDGEPAETILATEARLASRRLARAGLLTIEHVRGADHTFSRSAHREELVGRVLRLATENRGQTRV